MFIYTDNGADLSEGYLQENDVGCLNLSVVIDGKEYISMEEAGFNEGRDFYNFLRSGGRAGTSQVNEYAYYEAFRPIIERGEDVLYIGLSKGISGSYNSAVAAAGRLNAESFGGKVYVCDTLCASLGLGLLVDYAVRKKKEGYTAGEFYNWHKDNALRFNHWFTVDDLKFLSRGGRITASSAMIGSLIKIKPVLNVDEEGRLISREKVRGRKSSIKSLAEHLADTYKGDGQTAFISHGDCIEDVETLKELIMKKTGIRKFYVNMVGPVIGAHSGPGTLALFYFGDERYYKR